MKRKRKRRGMRFGLVLICSVLLAVFCYSSCKWMVDMRNERNEKRAFDALSEIVMMNRPARVAPALTEYARQRTPDGKTAIPETEAATDARAPHIVGKAVPLPQYAPLYEMNADYFGWVSIEDSRINYPVMYTPDRPEHYLKRAFDGSQTAGGVPFVDAGCPADGNYYLIYGHNMKNGTMFGELPRFATQSYFEKHPVVRFDTLYEEREYRVIAAFYARVYGSGDKGVFRYYDYTDLSDKAVFDEFIRQIRAASIYDTGFDARYGDELLALSTCSYHTRNGRFVVVAKRIDGE